MEQEAGRDRKEEGTKGEHNRHGYIVALADLPTSIHLSQ